MTYMPRHAMPGVGIDRFGMRHGSDAPAALAAFAEATEGLAAYRADTLPAVERALAAEPAMFAAGALKGLLLLLAGRAETFSAARAVCAELPQPAATADEAALGMALHAGVTRGPLAAAGVLDAHLARRPELLLLVKLSTMLRFVGGDAAGMRGTTARVLPSWSPSLPGYGYVLGCHAFALEEAGEYPAADRAGRLAVELAPHDAWAVHAVAHVHEMTHRPADGAAWIEARRPGWQGCNNFANHLSWHLGLFHLELGDVARVLEVYDRDIRADRSEDSRDYTNAVAMLWRLRQHGVDVGARWAELAEIARRRRAETTLVFAALHRLLALLAVGDRSAARDVAAALAAAADGADEQSQVAARVGARLAEALLAAVQPGGAVPLGGLVQQLFLLGGSHAQRDLFVRSLALLAGRRGDRAALADLLAARRQLKRDDRFLDLLAA
jgi:tetratricopeptide (TPR) repeat protein